MVNIIFDWSGVISDDFQTTYEACMIIMQRKIGKTISIEEFKKEFMLPYMLFWDKYVPNMDQGEEHNAFGEVVRSVVQPTIIPGAKKVLEELKRESHKMIILSSHIQDKLEEEIEEYGLSGIFDEINASIHDKSEAIHAIMKQNKFNPNQTYYVGDMEHDMDAGKAAGVKRIAITTGYDTKEQLKARNPEFIINSLKELLEILE